MDSIELSKRYKEEKKAEKELLKKEKILSKQKEKTQLSLSGKGKSKPKDTTKGKTTKPKKKKKPTRGKLVKKLDNAFSRYIRLSYADKDGMCTCVTCGEKLHRKNMQAGHYLSRSNYKYRWDEKNVYCQDYVCNCLKNGNYKEYTLFMIRKHGQLVVENMIADKELVKISTPRIEEQIAHYEKCVKELLDSKGL